MLISRFTYCLYLLGLLYIFNIPTVHQNKYGHKFNFHQTKSMQKCINKSIYIYTHICIYIYTHIYIYIYYIYMWHGWLMVSHPVSSLGAPRGVFSDLPVTVHAALQQRGATFAAVTAVFKKNRRWCLAPAGCGGVNRQPLPTSTRKEPCEFW